MQQILGDEAALLFFEALEQPVPVSVRLHPVKYFQTAQNAGPSSERVPWHPLGYYLSERPVFTLDPIFHAGAYYVQEASSMFLNEALRQCVNFDIDLKILDLCAAPGGKSTLMASMMDGRGLLVANETIRNRTSALRENLEKWGYSNIAVTSAEAEEFAQLEDWFDVVVVDAPCSGEGLFRKDPDAIREWSLEQVTVCSARQKRILAAAVSCLAPGGILIFSTCTFNKSENTDNATWLANKFGLEAVPLDIPAEWGIEMSGKGYQFFPHKVRGEGFFLAVFRKNEGPSRKHQTPSHFKSIAALPKNLLPEASNWLRPNEAWRGFQMASGNVLALPAALENDFLVLDKFLKTKWFGTSIGTFKGKDFVPDHGLALSLMAADHLPSLELSLEQALRFLKKETVDLPLGTPNGWLLVRYVGLNLGWVKAMPNRMNNYLPPERRIRMDIRY